MEISARYGRYGEDKGVLYLILSIFGLAVINNVLIQSDFNNWLSYPPPGGYQQQYWGPPPPPPPPPGPWM